MPTLLELREEVLDCTRCPLAEGRTQVVFGVGAPDAELMFVGEGPGAEEDRQGLPFVGRSGKLLDQLVLEEMGLTRDDVFVANTVKCLRYTAQVQLGDGTWERVGRLVRRRYDGTVMAVDRTGTLVPKRVVGWHASPLAGRRVFRLSYRSAKRAGLGRVGVELTGDHEVLTDEGWVAVQDLRAGARVATGHGLSATAFDAVCGTLLGDGHLAASSSHISFSHSAHQAPYAGFKAALLAEFQPRVGFHEVAAVVGGERRHEVVAVRTLAHRSLRVLREEFYRDGSKCVPGWLLESLNARMLALWFMDDGYLRIRAGRRPLAEIATCGFAAEDLLLLSGALAALDLQVTVRRGRLHFDADASRRLSLLIAPYVPEPMRYKLDPDVAAAVPFRADAWHIGPPHVLYDEIVVEEVEPGTDQTFFCLDVEDVHNFVTAGGVVHNCRPPGNRDPRPEEVAACRPWLEQQIDLVDPKVIVTLGNFSTKLLLATTDGITKLRGRTYPYRSGAVLVPTFHPAAVLRGGAAQLTQMRADLARAKLALESP